MVNTVKQPETMAARRRINDFIITQGLVEYRGGRPPFGSVPPCGDASLVAFPLGIKQKQPRPQTRSIFHDPDPIGQTQAWITAKPALSEGSRTRGSSPAGFVFSKGAWYGGFLHGAEVMGPTSPKGITPLLPTSEELTIDVC
jgi:hypothetical protein